ncbi:helix-turn-helix domain-containing protein [Novosphingobium piscinae]|uniref:Helix-turn-helix domain-containing protein n=1 Tax=Novosphingobium piscinae TaxID=1507448 RepID=A0A7X1KQF2_9SPHN|nr:helix-turn-helix domain-containing protein [Novosphingobium piscinae]MBC2669702.1 helix-turn-helix domain-containing protein [Novosphingobium piscinae]
MRKHVLVLLADKASDDGTGIWASKPRLAAELEVSKPTVINTIKSLIDDGLLVEKGLRQNSNGFTKDYAINLDAIRRLPLANQSCHQSRCLTGQNDRPVKPDNLSSQAGAPHQSNSLTQTPLNQPEPPLGVAPARHKPAASSKQVRVNVPVVGCHLPKDWQPPAVNELSAAVTRMVAQWPAGAFEASCKSFYFHWQSASGPNAIKRDWTSALELWLVQDNLRMMQALAAGTSFEWAAPTHAAKHSVSKRVIARSDEDLRSRAIRAELVKQLGKHAVDHWFSAVALLCDGTNLRVICPSNWAEDYLRRTFHAEMSLAVKRAVADGGAVSVTFEVGAVSDNAARPEDETDAR